jgi:kumamolisin
MSSRLRPRRWLATGTVAGMALLGIAAPAASASQPSTVPVPQGANPALAPGATPTGTTAGSTPIVVSFILKGRNQAELAARVDGGWHGRYLTVRQFASRYGQTPQYVHALERYLRGYGIGTTVTRDNLDVTAVGFASEFDKALSVLETNYTIRSAGRVEHVRGSARDPRVPRNLASGILSILGLSNYAPFTSQAIPAIRKPLAHKAASTSIPAGELTPEFFVNHYHLSPVENAGDLGQGQTVGIVTLASVNPNVPTYFWHTLLGLKTLPNRITLENVDGGAGPVSLNAGSDETTLDVEQSGAIAPDAKIIVYQAPNTDYGFVDAFYHAASDNLATAVSASWGESETAIALSVLNQTESPTYGIAFDQAFLEMAAQGQSGFVSSADSGAYTAIRDAGTTNLSADSPADSPYVTAAGGTTLAGTQSYALNATTVDSVTIPEEMTWSSDYLWPLYQLLGEPNEAAAATNLGFDSGSGGGYSSFEPRPSYQQGVSGLSTFSSVDYLTPSDYQDVGGLTLPTAFTFNPSPTVSVQQAPAGRAAPDVAFNADPQTGYALYDPQFVKPYGTDILQFGGTSFVAPQLNGTTAVLASALHHRLGFWNPVVYAAAQSPFSPFTPITDNTIYTGEFTQTVTNSNGSTTTTPLPGTLSNNNLYYTGTPGTVYNPASGLGYADLAALGKDFAASASPYWAGWRALDHKG